MPFPSPKVTVVAPFPCQPTPLRGVVTARPKGSSPLFAFYRYFFNPSKSSVNVLLFRLRDPNEAVNELATAVKCVHSSGAGNYFFQSLDACDRGAGNPSIQVTVLSSLSGLAGMSGSRHDHHDRMTKQALRALRVLGSGFYGQAFFSSG